MNAFRDFIGNNSEQKPMLKPVFTRKLRVAILDLIICWRNHCTSSFELYARSPLPIRQFNS
jgi:hypothetical protein